MPLEFNCPNCHTTIVVNFLKIGEQAMCRQCNLTSEVPDEAIEVKQERSVAGPYSEADLYLTTLSYLNAWETPTNRSNSNLIWLVISVFLFFFLGSAVYTIELIGLIFLIILIHEMGHVVAMKVFGYKNVSMLFIPLLGAIVRGQSHKPTTGQRAMVSLAGPAPGIIIGIVILIFADGTPHHLLLRFAEISLFLNLFNIIPLHPLDGAQIMESTLFAEYPRSKVVFQFLTTMGLLIIAFVGGYLILIGFALWVLYYVKMYWIQAQVVIMIRKNLPDRTPPEESRIPEKYLKQIFPYLVEKTVNTSERRRHIASIAFWAWKQLHIEHSKPAITWTILFVYAVLLIGGTWVYFNMIPS